MHGIDSFLDDIRPAIAKRIWRIEPTAITQHISALICSTFFTG